MTFAGTLVDINNALDGMSFNHDAGYYGLADVAIVVNDQGNTGSGEPLSSAPGVANISVEPYDAWFTGFRDRGRLGCLQPCCYWRSSTLPMT